MTGMNRGGNAWCVSLSVSPMQQCESTSSRSTRYTHSIRNASQQLQQQSQHLHRQPLQEQGQSQLYCCKGLGVLQATELRRHLRPSTDKELASHRAGDYVSSTVRQVCAGPFTNTTHTHTHTYTNTNHINHPDLLFRSCGRSLNRSCKPWLIHVCQSAVTNLGVSMSFIAVVKHILPLCSPRYNQLPNCECCFFGPHY
jgi:hypothetical protein